jgi:hypothetical protein
MPSDRTLLADLRTTSEGDTVPRHDRAEASLAIDDDEHDVDQ